MPCAWRRLRSACAPCNIDVRVKSWLIHAAKFSSFASRQWVWLCSQMLFNSGGWWHSILMASYSNVTGEDCNPNQSNIRTEVLANAGIMAIMAQQKKNARNYGFMDRVWSIIWSFGQRGRALNSYTSSWFKECHLTTSSSRINTWQKRLDIKWARSCENVS